MLNPLIPIQTTLEETLTSAPRLRRARKTLRTELDRRLTEVGISALGNARKYPWELSGGMRQRVGLAAAIAKEPSLLIADEPTTALDATTQREVLLLLRRIQRSHGMGLLLITHDLPVAFAMSDRVLVMSQGKILEEGDPDSIKSQPTTDHTKKLLAAVLPLDRRRTELHSGPSVADSERSRATVQATMVPSDETEDHGSSVSGKRPLLLVRDLRKEFVTARSAGHRNSAWALKGVNIELRDGANVGVIGESGSGKTTLARCLLGLETPSSGAIEVDGLSLSDFAKLNRHEVKRARSLIQCVFQDPYSSLNPSHSVGYALSEAIRLRSAGKDLAATAVMSEVHQLLADVGLPRDFSRRRPPTLSGGQRQRVAIARALAMQPKILVCDEPVAALDMSVQAQVLQVLRDVQESGVNLLFITHDLAVARQMTDELYVLFNGEVVEHNRTAEVIDRPQHEYTRRLLASAPTGASDWLGEDSPQATGELMGDRDK